MENLVVEIVCLDFLTQKDGISILKEKLQKFYNEALQVGFELGRSDYKDQLYSANFYGEEDPND